MKHMTLYCHGQIKVTENDNYEVPAFDYPMLTIPENLSLVFYIPPGMIFDAMSGMDLYKKVRNSYTVQGTKLENMVQTIKASIKKTKIRSKDHSAKAERDQERYLPASTAYTYPRICTKTKNNQFAYNYQLNGMREKDHSSMQMVSWGLHEGGFGGTSVKPLAPGAKSTLQEMVDAAAAHDSGEVAIHCIFCRVAIVAEGSTADYYFATKNIDRVSINF